MRHLFAAWDLLAPQIKKKFAIMFLDFDGTLAAIQPRPEMVKLLPEQRAILESVSRTKDVKLAIVSGRGLAEIKKLVDIPGIVYVGNHGFQIEGPDIVHLHPSAAAARPLLEEITEKLRKVFNAFPGVMIENKTYTLSIHYRETPAEKVEEAKAILVREISRYLEQTLIFMTEGKKVWEIRPPVPWDKGKAVLWLLAQGMAHGGGAPVLPVYIGDDRTDEDAFKAIRKFGMAVRVTADRSEKSEADYFLETPEEVYEFLQKARALKVDGKES